VAYSYSKKKKTPKWLGAIIQGGGQMASLGTIDYFKKSLLRVEKKKGREQTRGKTLRYAKGEGALDGGAGGGGITQNHGGNLSCEGRKIKRGT